MAKINSHNPWKDQTDKQTPASRDERRALAFVSSSGLVDHRLLGSFARRGFLGFLGGRSHRGCQLAEV